MTFIDAVAFQVADSAPPTFFDIWGPIFGSLGVGGALVGLMVWLVRSLVGNEKRYATDAIAAEKLRADERVAGANAYAEERVAAEKERAEEWKVTAKAFEKVNIGLTDSLKEALESNKITDHFFASYLPKPLSKPPTAGDNGPGEVPG